MSLVAQRVSTNYGRELRCWRTFGTRWSRSLLFEVAHLRTHAFESVQRSLAVRLWHAFCELVPRVTTRASSSGGRSASLQFSSGSSSSHVHGISAPQPARTSIKGGRHVLSARRPCMHGGLVSTISAHFPACPPKLYCTWTLSYPRSPACTVNPSCARIRLMRGRLALWSMDEFAHHALAKVASATSFRCTTSVRPRLTQIPLPVAGQSQQP